MYQFIESEVHVYQIGIIVKNQIHLEIIKKRCYLNTKKNTRLSGCIYVQFAKKKKKKKKKERKKITFFI